MVSLHKVKEPELGTFRAAEVQLPDPRNLINRSCRIQNLTLTLTLTQTLTLTTSLVETNSYASTARSSSRILKTSTNTHLNAINTINKVNRGHLLLDHLKRHSIGHLLLDHLKSHLIGHLLLDHLRTHLIQLLLNHWYLLNHQLLANQRNLKTGTHNTQLLLAVSQLTKASFGKLKSTSLPDRMLAQKKIMTTMTSFTKPLTRTRKIMHPNMEEPLRDQVAQPLQLILNLNQHVHLNVPANNPGLNEIALKPLTSATRLTMLSMHNTMLELLAIKEPLAKFIVCLSIESDFPLNLVLTATAASTSPTAHADQLALDQTAHTETDATTTLIASKDLLALADPFAHMETIALTSPNAHEDWHALDVLNHCAPMEHHAPTSLPAPEGLLANSALMATGVLTSQHVEMVKAVLAGETAHTKRNVPIIHPVPEDPFALDPATLEDLVTQDTLQTHAPSKATATTTPTAQWAQLATASNKIHPMVEAMEATDPTAPTDLTAPTAPTAPTDPMDFLADKLLELLDPMDLLADKLLELLDPMDLLADLPDLLDLMDLLLAPMILYTQVPL
jgi:hypothetical protein